MRTRPVPEDRIKTLQMFERLVVGPNAEEYIREKIINNMGQEIARKLMEFNKVIIKYDDWMVTYVATIEVIVPPTPKENL